MRVHLSVAAGKLGHSPPWGSGGSWGGLGWDVRGGKGLHRKHEKHVPRQKIENRQIHSKVKILYCRYASKTTFEESLSFHTEIKKQEKIELYMQ